MELSNVIPKVSDIHFRALLHSGCGFIRALAAVNATVNTGTP